MKPVLILTASFGEGHNAASRNLRDALLAQSPGTQVVVSDVFFEAYGFATRLSGLTYLVMINRTPSLWRLLFEILHRTRLVDYHMVFYRQAAKKLRSLVDTLQPGTVVSVYPGCGHLLDFTYRKRLRRPFRTVTLVTDSLSVNAVWYRAFCDDFIVPNQATADKMERAGVRADKLHALGFPTPLESATRKADRPAPPPNGLWRVLYVINSAHHVAPHIARQLRDLPGIRLTITVGHHKALGKHIQAEALAAGRDVTVLGWTSEMPRLMAESHLIISKAGGATVQEALAAGTPMILTQVIPGQEEGNARLLLEAGAARYADQPETIAQAVQDIFAQEGRAWRDLLAATGKLSQPTAAADIANFL